MYAAYAKSKNNLSYQKIKYKKEVQRIKGRKNNLNNNFIYQESENKDIVNENDINEIKETKISENIKITQKESFNEHLVPKITQRNLYI